MIRNLLSFNGGSSTEIINKNLTTIMDEKKDPGKRHKSLIALVKMFDNDPMKLNNFHTQYCDLILQIFYLYLIK